MLAEATSADYVRDPTRWGSAEVAALFPKFKHLDIRNSVTGRLIPTPPEPENTAVLKPAADKM